MRAAMRRRHLIAIEPARNLTQAFASGVLVPDPVDDARRNRGPAPWARPWLLPCSSRSASLCNQALQLVDRNESRAPRHLNGLNQREDASVEGGAADPERFRRLRARTGQPLDACCLARYGR